MKTPKVVVVRVTDEIINRSSRRDPHNCVIQNAVSESLPNATVSVKSGIVTAVLEEERQVRKYELPIGVARMVMAYDGEIPLKPFSFRLTGPKIKVMRGARKTVTVTDHLRSPPGSKSELAAEIVENFEVPEEIGVKADATEEKVSYGAQAREVRRLLRQRFGPGNRYLGT